MLRVEADSFSKSDEIAKSSCSNGFHPCDDFFNYIITTATTIANNTLYVLNVLLLLSLLTFQLYSVVLQSTI